MPEASGLHPASDLDWDYAAFEDCWSRMVGEPTFARQRHRLFLHRLLKQVG